MVLLQRENIEKHKSRLAEINIRIVHDGEITEKDASLRGIHLHPKDFGAAILSLDEAHPPESWLWAGQDWVYHSLNGVVTGIKAIDIRANDPDSMAERWSNAIGFPPHTRVIGLEEAEIVFVAATNGRGDGLSSASLVAKNRHRAGNSMRMCGFGFRLIWRRSTREWYLPSW